MSRVIKNNDGVAVVEGTPAASLVKDVEKFFASKPPERMAGESISQPRRLTQFTEEEIADKRGEIFKRLKDGSRRQVTVTPGGESRERIKAEREEVSQKYGSGKLSSDVMDQVRAEYGYFPGSNDDPRMGGGGQYLKSQEERNLTLENYRNLKNKSISKENREMPKVDPMVMRNEAKQKAESRRERFFERRRSAKEAERSQKERDATKGKFISTLGR